ncbi:tetratricopeptide repeat protein [Owenweeksia hongkongensis]|uniref:tetratricopeptide repeat protein n=1 Tax=Owenweeksia hongkongensis TaxID=253245 RepID=UPI003A953230
MKKIIVTTILLASSLVYGFQSIEELKVNMGAAKTPDEKGQLATSISYSYSKVMPDSGIVYGERALLWAEEAQNTFEAARANSAIGINYMSKAVYPLALEFQTKALKQFMDMDSLKHAAGTESNISLIFMKKANYKLAMKHAINALKGYEKLGIKHRQGVVLENIGTLFFRQGEFEKTKEYYDRALKLYIQESDSAGIARNRGNIGMMLSKMGQYAESSEAQFEALSINRRMRNQQSVAINLANIGMVESRRGNYEKALVYYDSAQVMNIALGAEFNVITTQGNIGGIYMEMSKRPDGKFDSQILDKGISELEESIEKCLTLSIGDPAINFYKDLGEAYALKGDYEKALEIFKAREILKDSIHSASNKISLESMAAAHDLTMINRDLQLKERELKIKDLELNESQQRVVLFVMGFIILVLMGLVSIFLLRKARLRNKKLKEINELYAGRIEEQLASLKKHATVLDEITYMQAHHVREPVATILGMVEHFNLKDPHDPMNIFIIENLSKVAGKLDVAVREVINKKEEV